MESDDLPWEIVERKIAIIRLDENGEVPKTITTEDIDKIAKTNNYCKVPVHEARKLWETKQYMNRKDLTIWKFQALEKENECLKKEIKKIIEFAENNKKIEDVKEYFETIKKLKEYVK